MEPIPACSCSSAYSDTLPMDPCSAGMCRLPGCTADQIQSGSQVVGLIKSLAPDRLPEEQAPYGSPTDMVRTRGPEEEYE
jgi:hypothetical protein